MKKLEYLFYILQKWLRRLQVVCCDGSDGRAVTVETSGGGAMNARAVKILMNWIICVSRILVLSTALNLSREDRTQLATLTAQLQAAMDEGKPRHRQRPGR